MISTEVFYPVGMLLAMIGSWGAENAPVYSFMDHGQTIAYVKSEIRRCDDGLGTRTDF